MSTANPTASFGNYMHFLDKVISAGLSGCSFRINPSVWICRTLSLYGFNNSKVVLRPCANKNGVILGYSPLKGLPGFVNWNRHWSDPTSIMELSV
ncbi:hypothetical protein RIR_jg1136.t1 [Rhizophagus irregularis DAOM 181602=DAOM 197198]|nr:hypothetical protein RIR_jg1136.t1 [Rhizophagus irregularis DAOM 181602=DAOM 197198]